jgi:hypothetical protein
MKNTTNISNPINLSAAGEVIESRGQKPIRIRLADGLTLRLSETSELYIPEK